MQLYLLNMFNVQLRIEKYGGVWFDASSVLTQPLEEWDFDVELPRHLVPSSSKGMGTGLGFVLQDIFVVFFSRRRLSNFINQAANER